MTEEGATSEALLKTIRGLVEQRRRKILKVLSIYSTAGAAKIWQWLAFMYTQNARAEVLT